VKVSVIIPTYNHALYLTKSIESVYNQSYTDFECIVINDGSTDNTTEVLDNLKDKYPELIIISKENGGLSSARNVGIKKSNGDLVCFLDSDDYWLPDKLLNQVSQILQGYDCVYSNYIFFDENKIETENNEIISEDLTYYDFISRNPITGSASSIMIRKECINKVGFFSTKLRSLEDLDYWFRLFNSNFKFKAILEKDVMIMKRLNGNMSQDYITMYFTHLHVFYSQLKVVDKLKLEPTKLKTALLARLNKIGWYAKMSNDASLTLLTSNLKIHFCGRIFLLRHSHLINALFRKLKVS
jgi:glycosyltransferase involved in cell wall biosynthesis